MIDIHSYEGFPWKNNVVPIFTHIIRSSPIPQYSRCPSVQQDATNPLCAFSVLHCSSRDPLALCTKHNSPQSPSPSLPTHSPPTSTLAAYFQLYWVLFLCKNLALILLILLFSFIDFYSVFSMSFSIPFWFYLLFPL